MINFESHALICCFMPRQLTTSLTKVDVVFSPLAHRASRTDLVINNSVTAILSIKMLLSPLLNKLSKHSLYRYRSVILPGLKSFHILVGTVSNTIIILLSL